MNSMERILATIGGKYVDRRAVTPLLSLYGARLIECDVRKYYEDPASYAAGQAAVRKIFRPDALFAPFSFASLGEAFGSELHFFKDQTPNIRTPVIDSADDWPEVIIPDPDTHPKLLYFRKAVQIMAKESKGDYPVAAVLPPTIDLPALVMGIDNWLETILFDRAKANEIVENITPFFAGYANDLLADGAAFIVLPVGFASPSIVTREIASAFSRPRLQSSLSLIKGPVVLHHIGAKILPHLDLLTGIPQAVAYVVDHDDDLAQSRKIIGNDAVLFGGPKGPDLARMKSEQVEKDCIAILEERKLDARFILCTTGADIPLNTPPENIHALLKGAESFGGSG